MTSRRFCWKHRPCLLGMGLRVWAPVTDPLLMNIFLTRSEVPTFVGQPREHTKGVNGLSQELVRVRSRLKGSLEMQWYQVSSAAAGLQTRRRELFLVEALLSTTVTFVFVQRCFPRFHIESHPLDGTRHEHATIPLFTTPDTPHTQDKHLIGVLEGGERGDGTLASDEGSVDHAREAEHSEAAVLELGELVPASRRVSHRMRGGVRRGGEGIKSHLARAVGFLPKLRGSKPRSPAARPDLNMVSPV